MQMNARAKAPSRTGYQGTAKRGSGIVSTTSPGHEAPPSRGATRGRQRGRGRGRGHGRGQEHSSQDTFSFTAPNNDSGKSKRKRSLANAILNAPTDDASKPIEHFKTPSMVRKAELAARSLADRAPDMQSVGVLSRPSDYGGGRTIRKKSQMLREDSEMGQSNQSPAVSMEAGSKSRLAPDNGEETVRLGKSESQIQAEIIERTANIDLYKTNTSDQIAVEADRRSRDLPRGVPTGPRALFQEKAHNVAKELRVPESDDTRSTFQQFQIDDVNDSPPAELQTAKTQPLKPVTKMNLKEYKSRRNFEFLGDAVPAHAIFGNQEAAPMLIGFTDIDKTHKHFWLPILSGIGVLNFSRIGIAQEFQTQLSSLQSNVLATGNIISGAEGTTMLEEIAEWLRPCSGLIFIHSVFCVLMFPAKCEEWKFLDSSPDIDHRLRYQIYEPKSFNTAASQLDNVFAETTISSLYLNRHYLETLVDLTQNLQYQALLPPHPQGQDVHNFYLFFPKEAVTSAKYIITWLRACKPDCRIYTDKKSGSWDFFSNNPIFKAGTIIIHEYLLPSIFKIPRLAGLINNNAPFSFWCMDDGSCTNPFRLDYGSDDAMPSCEASMIRLFPHGGAVFLTPSFLITQPERTYDLLKWFQRKLSFSTQGTWRLVLPHQCRQYLLDLAVEKASAREKLYKNSLPEHSSDDLDEFAASQYLSYEECKARFQSYVMLDQLLKNEYMAGFPGYWEEDSPDDFESPVIYADESVNQNDEKALVSWFAGWTMLHLNLFRKFFVIGTTPLKKRANESTAKRTDEGTEYKKGSVTAVVQKPLTPQVADPLAITAVKKRNRNEFSEVKHSLPSMTVQPLEASEPSNARIQRDMSQSGAVPIELGIAGASPCPTSVAKHYKPRDSEPVSRPSRQESRTRHGIDENQPPAILEFIAITGTEAETARKYLARYNGDVHTAVQRYWYFAGKLSSPRRLPQMDGPNDSEDPAAVVDFIAGTHASAQVAERYLLMAQDDVRRAITLYNESQQFSRSPSGGLPSKDAVNTREDGHEISSSRISGDHATMVEPADRNYLPSGLQNEGSDISNNNESLRSREAQLNSRTSLREVESDLNANSTNYVHPDSRGLFEVLNKMNQVPPTMDISREVSDPQLLVKGTEFSHERIARTLSGQLRGEPEAMYNQEKIMEVTQKFREQRRATPSEQEYDLAKDLRPDSTKELTTVEQPVPEGDILFSYDGTDERQGEDRNRLARKSGIVSNEASTRQFVPRSVRPSGTIRPEISIRPGYVPREDKPVYKNRRVLEGIPQNEAVDMEDSSSGSRNSSTVQSPAGIGKDTRRVAFPDSCAQKSAICKIFQLDPNFETTVEWYDKLRKNGQGWEHVYVGGWEACFPRLTITKK